MEMVRVQSLSLVQLFVTPQTAAHQASLFITNSRSPPKPVSTARSPPSAENHCRRSLFHQGLGLHALWSTMKNYFFKLCFIQFSSVAQSCPTLCHLMDCSMLGLPVHHQLPEFTQTHVHWVSDAIQPSHPLSSPSPAAFSLSQHQGLFQRISSSHQVTKGLEFQLQHQSFQWIFRTDFL